MLRSLLLVVPSITVALSPVVIVPGDGSNQLEARINKPSTVSPLCKKKSDWFRLWLDAGQLLLGTSCWADNIKLIYDEVSDSVSNNLGVETRVPDFGGTSSFEELDPSLPLHASAAFRTMISQLVSQGYERNVTLRGAPYDFRYAPSSPVGAKFTNDLRSLIEETSHSNGGRRVSLISHSMGCLQVLYLLQQQSQVWKDTYIELWVPISGVFAGAAKEMRLHASGDNQGLPVSPKLIRDEQRSYETNYWIAPVPSIFHDRLLVSTPARNYTAQDYDAFFEDIGYPQGVRLMKRVVGLTASKLQQHPGVTVSCFYSLGVPTPERFVYGSSFDEQPQVVNGDGDGTVNEWSLKICEAWAQQPQAEQFAVSRKVFSGISHSAMIMEQEVLKALLGVLGLSPAVELEVSI